MLWTRCYFVTSKLTLLALILMLIMACGGGGGSDGGEGEDTPTVIQEKTTVIDQQSTESLVSVSEDGRLQFSQSSDLLKSLNGGDIIVSDVHENAPNGFLRRVHSISEESDGSVTIETEIATLEEAIEDAKIKVSQQLFPNDIQSIQILSEGVSQRKILNNDEFVIPLSNLVLFDIDNNDETVFDQVKANGYISINPSYDLNISISGNKLNMIEFLNKTTEKFQIEISAFDNEISIDSPISGEKEIMRYSFSTYTAWAGPVPIVITPVLTINVGFEIDFSGNASISIISSVTQQATLTAGLKYENSDWNAVKSFSNDFDFTPPTLNMGLSTSNLKLRVYSGPQMLLKLYGIAGPSAGIDAFFRIDIDLEKNPWWILYSGLQADLGIDVELFGDSLANYDKKIPFYETTLAEAEGSYTSSDSDHDGVTDDVDICPNTPSNEQANENGCSSSQIETKTLISEINFSDPSLKDCILDTGQTYAEDVTSVSCSGLDSYNIITLDGIENLNNLESLNLDHGGISDLSPLANLINLKTLGLDVNNITDISSLSKLTNLSSLYLGDNYITDISPISGLINLKVLNFETYMGFQHGIMDLSPLSGLFNLTSLYLGNGNITDIAPLVGLANLERLNLYENNVSDITSLFELYSLSYISLSGNDMIPCHQLEEIEALFSSATLSLPNTCVQ